MWDICQAYLPGIYTHTNCLLFHMKHTVRVDLTPFRAVILMSGVWLCFSLWGGWCQLSPYLESPSSVLDTSSSCPSSGSPQDSVSGRGWIKINPCLPTWWLKGAQSDQEESSSGNCWANASSEEAPICMPLSHDLWEWLSAILVSPRFFLPWNSFLDFHTVLWAGAIFLDRPCLSGCTKISDHILGFTLAILSCCCFDILSFYSPEVLMSLFNRYF